MKRLLGVGLHAVVVNVVVTDFANAMTKLREQVRPEITGAAGFVTGYWIQLTKDRGTIVAIFESEEAAQSVAGLLQRHDSATAAVDSLDLGEVILQEMRPAPSADR